MDYLKEKLEKTVREAGKLFHNTDIIDDFVVKNGAANYVTQVDFQVQEFLQNELSRIIEGCNIITEESNENIFDIEKPTFILDPVDGTTNLIHQFQHSAVSLGLVMERKLVLGIIYNPFNNEMFTAQAGMGAALNGKEIKVSRNAVVKESLIGFGTNPYDRDKAKETFDITERVFLNCRDIRRTGSAALDIAYVACGRIDGFFESNQQPWDFAAGIVILEEAGGRITKWSGAKLDIVAPGSVLATNSLIHKELQGMLT